MLSQSGQGWRICKPPERGFKVWDSNIFRFWQRWCQLSGSQDLFCQVVHEEALASAAQEIKYTWTLKGRSSTSLKASSRQQRKSGKAKRNKQLSSERNWGKRDMSWVQHSMSITTTAMGWPCENGNSTARAGYLHVSLQSLSTTSMSEKRSVIFYCLCCTVYCWNELLPKFILIYSNHI